MFHLAVFEEATCRFSVVASGAQARMRGATVNIKIPTLSVQSAARHLLRSGSVSRSSVACIGHGSVPRSICSRRLTLRAFNRSSEETGATVDEGQSHLNAALLGDKQAERLPIPRELHPGYTVLREVSLGGGIFGPAVRSASQAHTRPPFPRSVSPQRRTPLASSAVSPRTAEIAGEHGPLNQIRALPPLPGFNAIESGDRGRRTSDEGCSSKLVSRTSSQGLATWTGAVGLLAVLTGQLSGNLHRLIGATAALSTTTTTATRLPLSPSPSHSSFSFMDTPATPATPTTPATQAPPATPAASLTAADIGDAEKLHEWLEKRLPGGKTVLERWGRDQGTKRVANLWQELVDGEVCLVDSSPPLRKVSVASVHVRHAVTGKMLLEAMQEMGDGTVRSRNRPLSEKMRSTENPLEACRRGIFEELGEDLGASDRVTVLADTLRQQVEERDSFSYPGLRTQYEIHIVTAVVEGLPDVSFCTVENEGQERVGSKVHRCAAVTGQGPCMWAGTARGESSLGGAGRPCGQGAGAGAVAGAPSKNAAAQGLVGAGRGGCGRGVCSTEGDSQGSGSDGEQRALGVKRHFWVWS